MSRPMRETEGMPDKTDYVADWTFLNAMLLTMAGADMVHLTFAGGSGSGESIGTGTVSIADGKDETLARLERVLLVDPAIGIIRHADAGYEIARNIS